MSSTTVQIAAPAAAQIERARNWWLENRTKAPGAFDDDLAELISWLELHPELVGRPLEQQVDVRRVYLNRIRYYAYFEIADDGRVVVLAIWHGRRAGEPPL